MEIYDEQCSMIQHVLKHERGPALVSCWVAVAAPRWRWSGHLPPGQPWLQQVPLGMVYVTHRNGDDLRMMI